MYCNHSYTSYLWLQLPEQWPEEREDRDSIDDDKGLVKAKKTLMEADVIFQLGSHY